MGMEGRVDLKAPAWWTGVYVKLKKEGGRTAQLANEISDLLEILKLLSVLWQHMKNTDANLALRKKALLALSAQQRQELKPLLPVLFKEAPLRRCN